MFTATIHADHESDVCVAQIHRVESLTVLLGCWIEDRFAAHPGKSCAEVVCFADPPTWAFRIGLGRRLSVGRLMHDAWFWSVQHKPELVDEFEVQDIDAASDWGLTLDDIHAQRRLFRVLLHGSD